MGISRPTFQKKVKIYRQEEKEETEREAATAAAAEEEGRRWRGRKDLQFSWSVRCCVVEHGVEHGG